jgi:L-alanine-DL-glutamate epimerase-like enolase superfamily enzyme
VYATGGWLGDPIATLVDDGLTFKQAGYSGFKVKIGLPDWRDDVERLRRLREAVGQDFELLADVNPGWTEWDARAAAPALAEVGLRWLEEPVAADDLDTTARLTRDLPFPVAGGEATSTAQRFLDLLQRRAFSILTPDAMKCGGPTGFLRVAPLAAAYGVRIASHTCTEISAHLISACPSGSYVEHIPGIWDRLFESPVAIEAGCIQLSATTGNGLRVATEARTRWAA